MWLSKKACRIKKYASILLLVKTANSGEAANNTGRFN